MCRRRGWSENVRRRLRNRSARKKRHTKHRHPERTTGVEPDLATTCHLSSWEERQNSPTSTSVRVDDADERHAPTVMLNHQRWPARYSKNLREFVVVEAQGVDLTLSQQV